MTITHTPVTDQWSEFVERTRVFKLADVSAETLRAAFFTGASAVFDALRPTGDGELDTVQRRAVRRELQGFLAVIEERKGA
jgi:hypothetical protein